MSVSSWPSTKLGAVLQPVARAETPELEKEYRLLGVRLDGRGPFLRETVTGAQTSASSLFRVEKGDFIYSRLFAWRGAFGVIGDELAGCYVSSEFPTFVSLPGRVDVDFLRYWFRLSTVLGRVEEDCSGSTPLTRNRFKEQFFLDMEMPLPPLEEQRRLVARIGELSTQILEAQTLRRQNAEEAEALTRSHLNKLFGDFYAARAGSLRLDRWERLDAVTQDVADGPHVTPAYVPDGIPFITVLNITSGRIRFGDHKFITPEDHIQFQRRAKAEAGDVLISKDGTIGVPCFVDVDREFSFFVSVALIKPKREVLDGEFLVWALRAPYLQERIEARSRGDMIRHLVLREIRDLTVPVPPLTEQRRIVEELDALQVEVDALKRLQAETAAELDALLPSILDKAFRGEL
jgi:type I restriction enzyme S subunit